MRCSSRRVHTRDCAIDGRHGRNSTCNCRSGPAQKVEDGLDLLSRELDRSCHTDCSRDRSRDDNIVFISILVGKLPTARQALARKVGLALAMIARIVLLLSLTWIMRLTKPLFEIGGHGFSGRDLILLLGGVFLIWKSVHEIHQRLEGETGIQRTAREGVSMGHVLLQIALLDIVFSLDSVITAVGMANEVVIMILAIVIAVGFMIWAAAQVSAFVDRHPTVKMRSASYC